MPQPTISLVIPNYNHARTLKPCLERILEMTRHPRWELIVVDDGSTDGSVEFLSRMKGIKLIRQTHKGAASALNAGFAAAGRNPVVRIHSDVLVDTPDWLSLLVETAEEQPKGGVVGVKLVYPDNRIQAVGRNLLSGFGWHPRHCDRLAYQLDSSKPGPVQEVDCVPGALAYYRREVLDASGGADENFWPAWADDDDLCIAARFHGFKVYVQPAIKAIHLTRTWTPTSGVYFQDQLPRLRKLTWEIKEIVRKQHAAYWDKKWGWNPLYPDLNEIRRLYGRTEICWRIGESLQFQPADWPPTVDACMVTWNNLPMLRRCLDSLAKTDYPKDRLQIWITDNASTDGTAGYLAQLAAGFPFRLQVSALPVNTGCPVGMNWAITQGQAQLVARLDDDILLPADWLRRLVENFRRRPYAGVVGPKIINDDGKQAIQCSDYTLWPSLYGHDDEVDHTQADYLARAGHVRGCCNVYRRDALNRCGLLDIRYSPSQCDDPDHQLALIEAGYEVIYDGHVRVVHKLTNGIIRSHAAVSNQQGNQQKMYGKWGINIYEIVDKSLDLSREGRYLPDDGDTAGYMAIGPKPEEFPRPATATLTADDKKFRSTAIAWLNHQEKDPEYAELILDHLDLGASLRRDGHPRAALDVLHTALNFAPDSPAVLDALIDAYQFLGETDQAERFQKLRRRLAPEQPPAAGTPRTLPSPASQQVIDQYAAIGETKSADVRPHQPIFRVLMVNTYENRAAGGDMVQLKKTKEYLERLGVAVDINCTARPDPRGYDLIHLWNLWFPHQTLRQLKAIRLAAPDVPVVLSPIYWDMSEKAWTDQVTPRLFAEAQDEEQLRRSLKGLANDQLLAGGVRRTKHTEPNFSGYETYQKQILEMVDYLLPLSYAEMRNMDKTLGILRPYAVVRNAAECEVFQRATPDRFRQQYGVRDFVLTVGLVEPRKNQLMLLHALRDCDLPVVVIGRNYDRNYLRLCRKYAPPKTLFIEHMPHELLASAYQAARVHALPSWAECAALVNIEAALSGCALAVSNRTSEPEYYNDCAYYCDPASIDSIRDAVLNAYRNYERDASKRQRLREQFLHDFTWARAAEQTFHCYQVALKHKQCPPAPRTRKGTVESYELPNNVYAEPPPPHPLPATRPQVSVVVPVFNKMEYTQKCIAALHANTGPHISLELIVVDNGSADGTHDFLRAEEDAGRLRVVRNTENLGFARACNQGARAANGKYLLFLNNDTEVQPGWLDPLVSLADADPAIAAVGSKLSFPDGTIQHAGVTLAEVPGRDPLLAVHAFWKAAADLPAANQRRVYQALSAACLLVRKSAFEAIGGFDEGFWNGYEDIDLCLRFQERGWLSVYEPASVVVHHASQSGPARFQKVQENIRRLHQKWLGKVKLDILLSADGKATPAENTRVRPYERKPAAQPLTSIIILAHNQLDHTRRCLESIEHHTPEPHELILVDNGSSDGTLDHFREYSAKHENVWVIANRTNRGFAAGNNQGIALARGDFVLLLNNDTVVAPGWLTNMLAVFAKHPQAGIVGPRSNFVLGKQLVEKAEYNTLEEMPGFASKWAEQHAGQSRKVDRVIGFCLLARRPVIDAVGGLDEQFGSGNLEDDDFCIRAGLAGFETRIADDAFIHHVGNATFNGAQIDYRQAVLTNWALFKRKWGIPAEVPPQVGYLRPEAVPPDTALKTLLPELQTSHEVSSDGRCWTEKGFNGTTASRAQKKQSVPLPPCARIGNLVEARDLSRQKRLQTAWETCIAAIKQRPFHPEAVLLLAEIAQAAGDSVSARKCAQGARELAPGWKAPKQFLQKSLKGNAHPDWLVLPDTIGDRQSAIGNRLSVCIIAKNEEQFLEQCLKSVKPIAHQIVLVDTGSTDRTVEIAKSHGAEVHHFAWCDDFSAARNAALERATGDWILMLDADEELPADQHARLQADMKNTRSLACRLPLLNEGQQTEGVTYVPRLFRNAPGTHFYGRIHEQVFPSLIALSKGWGLTTGLGTAQIVHHGYVKEVLKGRNKVERNLRLLRQAVQEYPNDANLVMNLGLELVRSQDLVNGLNQYREAFRLMSAQPPEKVVPELREALLTQFTSVLFSRREHAEIIRVLTSPLAKNGGLTASLHFALGLASFELKQYAEAAEHLRRCLAKRNEPAFSPINTDILTPVPNHCLALSLAKLGDAAGAEKAFEAALEEKGRTEDVKQDYARFLAEQNRPVEALHRLHEVVAQNCRNAAVWRLGGEIALSRPDFLEFAYDWTGEAIRCLPEDPGIIAQRAEVLMLREETAGARALWEKACNGARPPRELAALILCSTAEFEAIPPTRDAEEETATSREFVQWYQRLISIGAHQTIARVNSRLEAFRESLPTAARLLDAALSEAQQQIA